MGSLIAANIVLAWAWEDAKGDFAAYVVAAATVMLLGFPASVGAPKILTRIIREGIYSNQIALLRAQLKSAERLLLLSCGVTALLLVAAPPILVGFGSDMGDEKWSALTGHPFLVASWLTTSAFCMAVSHALMGFDDFRTAALIGARSGGVISNLCFLAATAVLWTTDWLSLVAVLWMQVLSNAIALVIGVYSLRKAVGSHPVNDSELAGPSVDSRASVAWLFMESWPNLIVQITSMGILPIELLLLSFMADDEQIADYAAVQRLQEVLASGPTLLTTIVAPFITELFTRQELKKLQLLLRGTATLVAIPTLAFLGLFIIAPVFSLSFTFGPSFVGGALALRIASIGSATACLTGPNGLTLIMVGKQRELLKASITACCAFLAIAPVLIYFWGIVGAATATALVFGTYNVVVTLIVHKEVGVWTFPTFSWSIMQETWRVVRSRPGKRTLGKLDEALTGPS